MGIISQHQGLSQKSKSFSSYYQITSTKEVNDTLIPILKKNTNIYRGVNEAKYRNFSFAQREWMKNDYETIGITYTEFVDALLNDLKENPLLKDYCNNAKIETNDLFYLSLLQHYGAPSPLLDFTQDWEIALFHASNIKNAEGKDIDQYCSLYLIDKSFLNNYDLQSARADSLQKAEKLGINERINQSFYDISWSNLCDKEHIYIDNATSRKLNGSFPIFNLNLIAQNGCFILLNNGGNALEDLYKEKLICFDIHKSLVPYIRENHIKKTKKDIFPNMENICKDTYNNFQIKLK